LEDQGLLDCISKNPERKTSLSNFQELNNGDQSLEFRSASPKDNTITVIVIYI